MDFKINIYLSIYLFCPFKARSNLGYYINFSCKEQESLSMIYGKIRHPLRTSLFRTFYSFHISIQKLDIATLSNFLRANSKESLQ